jgi:hypothetical protein
MITFNALEHLSTAALGLVLRRIKAWLSLIISNWTRNKSGAPKLTILSLTPSRRGNEPLTMTGPTPWGLLGLQFGKAEL